MKQTKFSTLTWYILLFTQITFTDEKKEINNIQPNDNEKKINLIAQKINFPEKNIFILPTKIEPVQAEENLIFYEAQQGPQEITTQPKKSVIKNLKKIPSYNKFQEQASKSFKKSQATFNDPFFTQKTDEIPNYQRHTAPNANNTATKLNPKIISLQNDLEKFNTETTNVFNNPTFTEKRTLYNPTNNYQIKSPTYSVQNDWNNFFDNAIKSSRPEKPNDAQIKNRLTSQSKATYQEKLFNSRLRMDYR